jgi:NADH:ubiquinone oxidoreductase subunit E
MAVFRNKSLNFFLESTKINSEINHDIEVEKVIMDDNNKIIITVCMGSSCFARGNAENLSFIENFIKENNLDAIVDLCGSRCEGKCAQGPNIIINGTSYQEVNEEKLTQILQELSQK